MSGIEVVLLPLLFRVVGSLASGAGDIAAEAVGDILGEIGSGAIDAFGEMGASALEDMGEKDDKLLFTSILDNYVNKQISVD